MREVWCDIVSVDTCTVMHASGIAAEEQRKDLVTGRGWLVGVVHAQTGHQV